MTGPWSHIPGTFWRCRAYLTIQTTRSALFYIASLAEHHTSTTLNPDTSHLPRTICKMEIREPTANRGLQPTAMDVPKPDMSTESDIAPEPKPHGVSDQVCEPATPCVTEGVLVEFESWEESPAHNLIALDVIKMPSGRCLEELLGVFPVGSTYVCEPFKPSSPASSNSRFLSPTSAGFIQPFCISNTIKPQVTSSAQ